MAGTFEAEEGISNGIKKGFALVDSWGNLHWLHEELDASVQQEALRLQQEALAVDLGLVVSVFSVETNEVVWDEAVYLIGHDSKTDAWQKILQEGKVN